MATGGIDLLGVPGQAIGAEGAAEVAGFSILGIPGMDVGALSGIVYGGWSILGVPGMDLGAVAVRSQQGGTGDEREPIRWRRPRNDDEMAMIAAMLLLME